MINWGFKIRFITDKERKLFKDGTTASFVVSIVGGELDGTEYACGGGADLDALVEKVTKDTLFKKGKGKIKGIKSDWEEKE